MSSRTHIRGTQIKDESIESVDIASGSIRAGELSEESIAGQTLITSTDTTNDRLLIWDATDSALKQVSPSNLGIGGGSPAGANTQIQFNDGGANFGASSNLTYDSVQLTVSSTGLNPLLNLSTTNDGSSAGPVFTLKRNSSSPADADYLGQIKFQGENDADQEVAYAKITGKIDDASDESEDGILEFANIKNGSQTITARLRSDSLQLLNSTNLSVDGTAEISGFLYHKDDNDTYIKFDDDDINFQAGGINFIDITQGGTNEITFNEAAADIDFRVEGTSDTHLLFVDGGNNKVGIGSGQPDELLTINAANDGDECFIQFKEAGADRAKIGINTSNNLLFHNQYANKHIVMKVNDAGVTREGFRLNGAIPEVVVNESSESLVDFRVESDNNTHMFYVDGGNNNIGINDSTPTSTLTIMGSLALKVNSINAANDPGTSYSISTTDCVLLVNTRPTAQGGIDSAITLTLPDASNNPGMVLTIKDAAGYCDVNAITITVAAGDNLDGNPSTTSLDLPSPASFKKLISDGANSWYEIGS